MWKIWEQNGSYRKVILKRNIMSLTLFLQVDITALTKFDFKLLWHALGRPSQQKVEKKHSVLQREQITFLFLSSERVIIVFIPLLKVN